MAYKDKKVRSKKQNEWIDKNRDKINLLVPKGRKEVIKQYAKSNNMNVTQFIVQLIENELSKNEKEI